MRHDITLDSPKLYCNHQPGRQQRYVQVVHMALRGDSQGRKTMRYLHTMVRVRDVDESLDFYCNKLGLVEMRRKDVPEGRFTLIFLAAPKDHNNSAAQNAPELELTFNWDREDYDYGRNFGHLAYKVDNIYQTCQALADSGVIINRPPRDGRMAFIKSPDNISIELLQEGDALAPAEPWLSMENTGTW